MPSYLVKIGFRMMSQEELEGALAQVGALQQQLAAALQGSGAASAETARQLAQAQQRAAHLEEQLQQQAALSSEIIEVRAPSRPSGTSSCWFTRATTKSCFFQAWCRP